MHVITLLCFRHSRLAEISCVHPCDHSAHRPSDSSLLINMKFQPRGMNCELSQSSRATTVSNPESLNRNLTSRHAPESDICVSTNNVLHTNIYFSTMNTEHGERRHAMVWWLISFRSCSTAVLKKKRTMCKDRGCRMLYRYCTDCKAPWGKLWFVILGYINKTDLTWKKIC